MDTIILAGGFAKRMNPTTNEVPKQLLPVAGKPMLSYVLGSLDRFYSQDIKGRCYLSINKKYENHFSNFLRSSKSETPLEVVVEDNDQENKKLGSIGGLNSVLEEIGADEDIFVIGGDNLFSLDLYMLRKEYEQHPEKSIVAVKEILDKKKAKKFGVFETGSYVSSEYRMKSIKNFEEKPEYPRSSVISTAIYLFSRKEIHHLREYVLNHGKTDAMGDFISYLVEKDRLNAYLSEGYWFDIGSHESFEEANRFFDKRMSCRYPDKKVLITIDKPVSMVQAICGERSEAAADIHQNRLFPDDAVCLTGYLSKKEIMRRAPYDIIIPGYNNDIDKDVLNLIKKRWPKTKISEELYPYDHLIDETKERPYSKKISKMVDDNGGEKYVF